jgi:peptidyl-prolyl cis-trans isomerase A (cyclophilin A)
MFRYFLLLALLCLGAPALAQTRVVLHTELGDVTLEVDQVHAPITAANFLRYVDARRWDGVEFYRAMPGGVNRGLIQAGIRDQRRLFPPIAHEPTSLTGLHHVEGALSMPRLALGTAQGDFTIMVGDMRYLDAGPGSGGDGQGYAVFGRVVEGMDTVRRILAAPTSPTEGEGMMRGQMLSPRIRIVTARRAP